MIQLLLNIAKQRTKHQHLLQSWCLLFFITCTAWSLQAQNNVSFEAFSDARQVLSNNYFEVSFNLKNADGQNFSPPSFNDFVILSGPSRGVKTTIINGLVSKEMTYTYVLQPKRVGKFTIGSATIMANNKSLRSKPFQVEVLAAKEGQKSNEQAFFVEMVPSVKKAYIGQQIRLDYKLFTTVRIASENITDESDYVGFYAEDIQRPDLRRRQEIIDGVQYVTKVLKSIALYPQQAGLLTIDPATIQLGVAVNNRRSSGLFFGSEIRRMAYTTEPLELNVRPLPDGAPADFSGAIGHYQMGAKLQRTTMTTDDALSLQVVIEGDGDIKRLQAPPIQFPESFEVYEPKVLEEEGGEFNTERRSRKIFEYICLPKKAGSFNISPSFTYFDPDSIQYVTLRAKPIKLNVRPGITEAIPIERQDISEVKDIQFISLDTRLKQKRSFFLGSIGFWLLLLLPIIGLVLALLYKRKLQKLAGIDPALLKSQKANQIAMARLEKGAKFLQENNSRAFYDEISKAMMGYVSDKLRIPGSEMTKSNMQARLQQLQIGSESVDQFMEIVRNCETALYAGMDNSAAMQATYDYALSVLAAIEKQVTS